MTNRIIALEEVTGGHLTTELLKCFKLTAAKALNRVDELGRHFFQPVPGSLTGCLAGGCLVVGGGPGRTAGGTGRRGTAELAGSVGLLA